ncbi:MAG: Adaptive-response sensory-kinase SasA [Gammaproteobacteria bacterium]|nr:Adaptive-response sensory-kinase SasA [Gammaproteobacteria bacterium]
MVLIHMADAKPAIAPMTPVENEKELQRRVLGRTAEILRINESLTRELAAHKGVEVELEQTRARLQHVLAVSPAITYSTEAAGGFACTFVSESCKEIMGYTPREVLDDPDFWTTRLHPQDGPRVLAEFAQLIEHGGGSLEYRFRHRDGHYRWFQDTFRVIRNNDGRPYEIVGSWVDITARRMAESFRVLYQASLQQPQGIKKWFEGILQTGRAVLHLETMNLLHPDAEGLWLRAVASTETEEPLEAIRVPIGPDGGALARAYLTSEPVIWDGQSPLAGELRLKAPYDQLAAFRSRALAVIPLLAEGHTIGVLAAGWNHARRSFEPAMLESLQLLASQAARALDYARLYAVVQPVLRRSLQLKEAYPAFAEAVKALVNYDRIGVVVPEGGKLLMALSVAEPPLASYEGESWEQTEGTAVDWVLNHKQPRLVYDLANGHTLADEAFIAKAGVRASLLLPLVSGGEAVGAFFLDSLTPGAYTERDIELLEPLAQPLALAIENTRLFEEQQERAQELARTMEEMKVLQQISQAVNSTLDLQTVLTTIVSHAVQLSGTDAGTIDEYDGQNAQFVLRATHGMDEPLMAALRASPVRLGEGAVGRAAVAREPVQFADIDVEAYGPRLRSLLARSGFRAILVVPLLREDRIVGGLAVCRRRPGEFPQKTVDLLKTFADQSVLAIENARLFREIEDKGRQLEIASRHKSQFLANMSHELRTPLNAILGYTELILDDIYGAVPARIREVLARVDKNGRHLLALINDVLHLSKIEAGSYTLDLGDYSMKEVVQAAVTGVEALATEKGLALKVDVPADLPAGRGDARRITEVLLNLIGNAIKFTENGEVRIGAALPDGAFQVSVADTGPGIALADQQRIFEAFQQADDPGSHGKGGTGLGLSIAKKIIAQHGGRMWVESTPGHGATFRFTLPVRVERKTNTP